MAEPKIGWAAYNAARADYLKAYQSERYKRQREVMMARSREWYEANKAVALERQKEYRARKPLTVEQKEARRIKAAARRLEDPQRAHDARHMQRARRRGCGAMPSRDKMAHLLDNAICAACGSSDKPEIDHILPLILGGTHSPDNLQVLCRPCNRSKGAKHPSDWKGRRATHR